jgi:SAM-dependent methyltransferase
VQTCITLGQHIIQRLCCPICRSRFELTTHFRCMNPECHSFFPLVNGIPILINNSASLFRIEDFVNGGETFSLSIKRKIKQFIFGFVPSISLNIKSYKNYSSLSKYLLEKNVNSIVLVIGGYELGQGMDAILSFPSIELVESDVLFGPRTGLICDAHDIPFIDNTFDAVIIQAVLEYVVDPYRCVDEIYRVLKKDGLVYAETPFIQQVHGGKFDFTRFTYLGHRRLFRKFDEISSGITGGPAMALTWSFRYFLLSFVSSKFARMIVHVLTGFTTWWLKYLDYFLINKDAAVDAASGCYFLGRKSGRILSDRELITFYRGCAPS